MLIRNIKNSSKHSTYVIVTHNALLRCLIGNIFHIPKYLWVKIQIKHIDPLNFIIKNNKILIGNLGITQNISVWNDNSKI